MDFLALVNRLKRESGRQGGQLATLAAAGPEDLHLVDWIQDAWRRLQNDPNGLDFMREEFSGATVIGTRSYTAAELNALVTDFGRWLPAPIEDYAVTAETTAGSPWPLQWMPFERWRLNFDLTAHTAARPQFWTVAPSGKLCLGPTPDAVYTVRAEYWHAPVELVDDDDEPDFEPSMHMVLVWSALMELASFDAAPEVYARAEKNFDREESDLLKRYGPKMKFGRSQL